MVTIKAGKNTPTGYVDLGRHHMHFVTKKESYPIDETKLTPEVKKQLDKYVDREILVVSSSSHATPKVVHASPVNEKPVAPSTPVVHKAASAGLPPVKKKAKDE